MDRYGVAVRKRLLNHEFRWKGRGSLWYNLLLYEYAPMVKGSRRRPLTAESGVRIPLGVPINSLKFQRFQGIVFCFGKNSPFLSSLFSFFVRGVCQAEPETRLFSGLQGCCISFAVLLFCPGRSLFLSGVHPVKLFSQRNIKALPSVLPYAVLPICRIYAHTSLWTVCPGVPATTVCPLVICPCSDLTTSFQGFHNKIETEASRIKGRIAFYCRMLGVGC